MSQDSDDLVKLLIALRDANAMIVEAINAYLASKAPPEVKFEKVAELFPKDLAEMLSFDETKDYIIVKPRQFLGSENFSKIAAIVKQHGGEYMSAGKESHFRISRKTSK